MKNLKINSIKTITVMFMLLLVLSAALAFSGNIVTVLAAEAPTDEAKIYWRSLQTAI